MANIDNRTAAIAAKQLYENYNAYMGSDWGQKLTEKMNTIENNAIDRSMRGSTPDDVGVFYESRGNVSAIAQLKSLFTEVEKDYNTAIAWLQANPPTESDASQETE